MASHFVDVFGFEAGFDFFAAGGTIVAFKGFLQSGFRVFGKGLFDVDAMLLDGVAKFVGKVDCGLCIHTNIIASM